MVTNTWGINKVYTKAKDPKESKLSSLGRKMKSPLTISIDMSSKFLLRLACKTI